MLRNGAANPEELIDRAIDTNDKIVSIDCQCCGKTFYVLESDLYIENVVRGENEPQLDNRLKLQHLPKCPHCGYCSKLTGNLF